MKLIIFLFGSYESIYQRKFFSFISRKSSIFGAILGYLAPTWAQRGERPRRNFVTNLKKIKLRSTDVYPESKNAIWIPT